MTNYDRSILRPFADASMEELNELRADYLQQVKNPNSVQHAYAAADDLACVDEELRIRAKESV